MRAEPPGVRPYGLGDVYAQTGTEAARFDARSIGEAGVPQPVLMENAGRGAAILLDLLYPGAIVTGLVGAGNNGGDALVVLRTLQSWGYRVRAVAVSDRDMTDPLLHGWSLDAVADHELDEAGWSLLLAPGTVVVDGLLGTGARGAPRERQAAVIRRVNDSNLPVLALDVPSGVDSDTGLVEGDAVQATVTIAFGSPKIGSLLHPGRGFAGRHVAVEIGFPPLGRDDANALVVTPEWARSRIPGRATDTHKNREGRVLIIGGQVGMAGAVILAARAAFAAGAGLVRIVSAVENREIIQTALPEAMFLGWDDPDNVDTACAQSDAIVVGPGLGGSEAASAALDRVLAAGDCPVLLDADALNIVAARSIDLSSVAPTRSLLLTPHPGEMQRLLGVTKIDPIATIDLAVSRFGCAVLYKGAPSIVGAPGRPVLIDTQSSSDLAVAGMGDTLSGVCATLLAQGLGADVAGALGLYLSGRAAHLAARGVGLTPSDVTRFLPDALAEDGDSSSDLAFPFVHFDADPPR